MHSKYLLLFVGLLIVLPTVTADTLTEDFEGYFFETKPGLDWYRYSEGEDIGNISTSEPIAGAHSFLIGSGITSDVSNRFSRFQTYNGAQLSQMTFTVKFGQNTEQYINIQSVSPVRDIVQFYIFCTSTDNPNGCEFRVRVNQGETTGQVLVPYTNNDMEFDIDLTFNWIDFNFCLFVDAVDDGCFDFLQIPTNVARVSFHQYRGDIAAKIWFDDWVLFGGINAGPSTIDGDFAEGMQEFATSLKFTTDGSKFVFGLVLFIILVAAIVVPAFTLSKTNTIGPAISFFTLLVVFWLIRMEFWPNWIEIFCIILVSGLIGLVLRKITLGITNANRGPSLITGSLGYFVICAAFLGFAGYQSDTILIPTGPPEESDAATDQSFIGAVTECLITGGAFTFGLVGDCDEKTVSTTWKTITDIFGWVQAGLEYLFQLLTFQLPIPVLFNLMIVAPPASTLLTYAIQIIRGVA